MAKWYCRNCDRAFHPAGIARHRAMHRDRSELVVLDHLQYRYTYDYREEKS